MYTWAGGLAPRLLFLTVLAAPWLGLLIPSNAAAASAPGIITQPQSQSLVLGSNAVFTVAASGQTPLFYQWSLNGTNLANNAHISGATNATVTVSNIVAGDEGNYQVVVTNSHGSAVSSNAALTVLVPAFIAIQPSNQVVTVSGNAAFGVVAGGTAPLSYRWSLNGAPLSDGGRVSGSVTANLNIADVQTSDNGSYQVMVTNNYGSVTSAVTLLSTTFGTAGVVRFVNVNSTNPVPPYTSWSTASTNIQSAIGISSASSNDTVLVAPGVYSESVNFNGKPVWLMSANGPANTWISPPGGTGGVSFSTGETTNSIISGFTITNGGIGVNSCSPLILSNVIVNCGNGQNAIGCGFASPWIIGNRISGCTGSGIYLAGASTPYIEGNVIQNNAGGIGMWAAGSPTIINNVIQNNLGTAIGMVNQCDANIVQNLIINNNGDGINAAVPYGARCPWIINNVIYGNTGNGIWEDGFVAGGEIVNNIVVGSPALNMNPWYSGPTPAVLYNDFYSTNSNVLSGVVTNVNSSNGDNSVDPFFVSAASGDFHLGTGSPCIDAGTNGAPLLPALDLDGYTRVIAGNSIGPAIADLGAYEFHSPGYLAIQVQPLSQTFIGGQNALFSVTAFSSLGLSYQWQLNATNISGATNASLFIANVQSNNAGIYDVLISNSAGSVTSSNAVLTVLYPPPAIITQPAGLQLLAGTNATFSCVATGYFTLQYQWQLNGTNLVNGGRISGATSPNLTITGVVTNDSGNYRIIVADNYHSVTSSVAALTVWQAPAVLTPPPDTVANVFGSCSISVTVTGVPPISLRWQKNGVNLTDGGTISGSSTPTLAITNLQFTDSGQYGVMASNAFGTATVSCKLTVVPMVLWGYVFDPLPPVTNVEAIAAGGDISWGEFNLVLRTGGTVVAWGSGYAGSTNVPAAATNVAAVAAGDYFALALRQDGTVIGWGDNSYGEATPPAGATNVVAIAAGQWHSLALRQDGTVIGWGDNGAGKATPPPAATNVVAIAAGNAFSLALRQDGTIVGWGDNSYGETSPPANATNVVAIAAGNGHALALRTDGTVTSWGYNAYGETNPPPNATNVVAIAAGNALSLALRADGTVVGWGDNAFGEATPPANLTNVLTISTREFHGMALIQNPATGNLPVILRQPGGGTPQSGQTFILNPLVTGPLPLSFQWYFNGAPLTGQTNNWLALVAINTNQAGNYQVVITNNFGAATSQVAVVSETPGIVTQPVSQIAFAGNNVVLTASAAGIGPLDYQWYLNGAPLSDSAHISGSVTANLSVSNLQMSDAGNYVLVVSNSTGSTTTTVASLGVASQPTNQTVLQGSGVSIPVTTNSPVPVFFQWLENGMVLTNGGRISGTTNSTLVISGAQTTDSGAYQVIASSTNSAVSTTSAVANLTVLAPVVITGQPSSQAVILGGTAAFTAAASGSSLTYQWLDNGVPLSDNGHISGSATPTLTIFNVQSDDVGGYVLVASNVLSSATSQTAALTPLTVPGPSVRYVNLNNTNPVAPYLNWSAAATNIQDAIDASVNGDTVLVTNGVYQVGGRVVYGLLTNRVVINKAITVQSVNGPATTTIRGNRPHGNSAVRCVYLTSNAVLTGFTLVGGATRTTGDTLREESGGGAWCESTNARLINCLINSNVAWLSGGGESFGMLSNCFLAGNTATNGAGGGTYFGVLNNCMLSNNFALTAGGGAYSNILNGCTLVSNTSRGNYAGGNSGGGGATLSSLNSCTLAGNYSISGGGAAQSTLNFCTISSNSVSSTGGGVSSCTLNNCVVVGNVSTNYGGGAISSTLNNCLVWANRSFTSGGGAQQCNLNNCTVVGNMGENSNGLAGIYSGSAKNCVVYDNVGQNSYVTAMTNCCTIPLPIGGGNGPNNFTNPPLFVNPNSDFHLQSNSPCINSGKNAYVVGATDLAGRPRIVNGTVDMGAYEFEGAGYNSFISWLRQYGLPPDGSADYTDSDGDGMNNYEEWLAGTDPTNPSSALELLTPSLTNNPPGIVVRWQSIANRTYFLDRSSNLGGQPAFLTLATNIPGQPGVTTYIDTNAVGFGPFFYRVGIQTGSNVLFAPISVISFAWLQQYGLPTDGSIDFADLNGTGMNVYQDWIAGLNPTNSASILVMLPPVITTNTVGVTVSWQSVNTRTYFLQRSGSLAAPFSSLHSNIVGQAGTTSYTDSSATNSGPYFYRVGVQ
jgi:parallel beta-helix repeat protein